VHERGIDAANGCRQGAKWREKETSLGRVETPQRKRVAGWTIVALAGAMLWCAAGTAADNAAPAPSALKPETMEAYNRYIQFTDARSDSEIRSGKAFLWIDAWPEEKRREVYAQLRGGEVVIEKLQTLDGGKPIECPSGIIHHWVAAVFVPGATLEQTLALVEDYDHQSVYYGPDVQRSKTLAHNGDDFKISLRFKRKKVITVVLNTEFDVHYGRVDATHAFSRARSTRVAQVEDHDTPQEHELPPGDDGGYMWRMDTYWRFLQADGGTYVQCEAVSLSRNIPLGFAWLVGPFVNSVPRESLAATLLATRKALISPPPVH
jgi:hypothetical protein